MRSFGIRSLEVYPISGKARGGPDQTYVEVGSARDALRLVENDTFVTAVKTFNLRLMRMGPTAYSRYHCFDLVTHTLQDGASGRSRA